MRDNKIRNAWLKLNPEESLYEKIEELVTTVRMDEDCTHRQPSKDPVSRPAKAALIAAAIIAIMALTVSAYGILSRLFYLPGAGLVDEDGILVITETDIGDLDITVYRTAAEVDFGDYIIESVTYTEYDGMKSYTVWSRLNAQSIAALESLRSDSSITIADHVIDDLQLTLSDGTTLSADSVRYSHSGSIVYNFVTEALDTKLTVLSESLNTAIPIKLCRVEGAGYSYMEYSTDQGITLILSPTNMAFTEWQLNFIDNSIEDGLAEYTRESGFGLDHDRLKFFDSNGEPTAESRIHTQIGSHNGAQIRFEPELDEGGLDIARVELDRIALRYRLKATEKVPLEIQLPMPESEARIDCSYVLFDDVGFHVEIRGYSRKGNDITVYVKSEGEQNYIDNGLLPGYFQIPYNGSNGCTSAHAYIRIASLSNGETQDAPTSVGFSNLELCEDGLYAMTFRIDPKGNAALDDFEMFSIKLAEIACVFDGSWIIHY